MNLADLKKPFPPDRISWRVGSMTQDKKKGMALAYIDARDVMGRLDEVCGAGWQCEYIPMPNGTCCCRLGIKVGEEWIWRSNGAMNLSDRDTVDAKEMAEKGSYSDAFKRAAVLFGIGQYLYDLDSPWVELDDKKRIVASEYKKLEALLGKATLPRNLMDPSQSIAEWALDYCAMQKTNIMNCVTVADVQEWAESQTDDLKELKKHAPALWSDLRRFKENRIGNINLEGVAAE
jgi:hypothetical protein